MSTYLDDSTLNAIEADLAAAHETLGHGDLSTKGMTRSAVTLLEVAGPAALLSYANARSASGELKAGPVPVDLGLGVALALASVFDLGGEFSGDLLNLASGCIASYAARSGAAFGAAAQLAPASKTSGTEISGAATMAGALPAKSPIPHGTQRFVVQRVAA